MSKQLLLSIIATALTIHHDTEHQKVDEQHNYLIKKPLNLKLLKLQGIYSFAK